MSVFKAVSRYYNTQREVSNMRSTVPMRTAKIGCYIVSALQLALGVILIAAPELSANVLCYLLGACLLVTGITRIIGYLSRDLYRLAFQFDLAFGILTAAIGLLLLLRPKAVINLVLLVCGILILTDGLFKIQIALDARGFGIRRWWLILIAAVAAGGFGLLLILKPDAGMATAMVLLGVALVLDALLTFAAMLLLVKIIRHQRPDMIDVEGEEVA